MHCKRAWSHVKSTRVPSVSVAKARTLADERRASLALADLADLPLRRAPHLPLLACCWELRHNLTPYDAAYVALAEALDIALVTADARLSRASGVQCAVEVLT